MAHVVKLPGGGACLSLGPQSVEEIQALIERRHKISVGYCERMGWPADPEKLSWDQILEIRALPEWKSAGGSDEEK